MKVLAGDIGGTSTRLALFEVAGEGLRRLDEERFPSRQFPGLEGIVRKFLDSRGASCERACFGIAGPVKGGRCETTNLPWVVEARRLEKDLGIRRVSLVNDLEANAHGIPGLGVEDFLVINAGNPDPAGNAAIISAGTGLGEAGLFREGKKVRPFATEGGHASFAPRSDLEIELLKHLSGQHEHVSWERVVSGPGLVTLYQFLLRHRGVQAPAWLAGEMQASDPAAAISNAALAGRCPISVEALEWFVSLYGAEAGNLALKMLATGGVFVGGGIAPRIARKLGTGEFMRAFRDKGRMGSLLEAMPVKVILNEETALLGAALYAAFEDAPA